MVNSNLDSNGDSSSGQSSQMPASVRTARWLFVFLGITWLVFGTWSIIRMRGGGGNLSGIMLLVIALLMFVNSAILIWIGWGIGKGRRVYYYFGLLALAGNIFLTLTDEFGLFDLFVLVIAIGLFLLLLSSRSNYLHS